MCALLPWVLAPLGLGLSGGLLGELSGGGWLLRACGRGRAKCGDPGGRKGPVAAWGEAVYLPPEGCVTARGSYWNVWPGDLDLLRLMEPTGGPAYRSTAMVAVIRAKGVLLFASAVVAPSVAAGSVCTVFQGGAEDCSAGFAFPGHMPTVSMPGKKNGHLPWGGVHKSAISRGHSESWFCRPAGPAEQGLGVPGASPRQEGLPWSYETMGRCRVPVRQTDGFWGRSNGTYLVFICSSDQLLGHWHIRLPVHLVSTSWQSDSWYPRVETGDSEAAG